MKIVIDTEKLYTTPYYAKHCVVTKEDIIKCGTPLPKGHGRLIDADSLIKFLKDTSKRQKYKDLLVNEFLTVDDVFNAFIETLQNKGLAEGDTPTIIEADKESDYMDDSHEKYITKYLIDNVFRNEEYYMLHDEETLNDMIWNLMEIIASLHNEYYKAVNGKYYDYMFHWVNKMNAGTIIDDIFKKENKRNDEKC